MVGLVPTAAAKAMRTSRTRPPAVVELRELDERRMLWAGGDIVENRPALSRWHPDYAEAFAKFVKGE